MWQFSRERKNPSNDCKSVAGLCKQLWEAQPWGTLGTRQRHTGTISTRWLLPTSTMGIPTLTRSRPDTRPACLSRAGRFPGSLGLSWDVHGSTFSEGRILVLCVFTAS